MIQSINHFKPRAGARIGVLAMIKNILFDTEGVLLDFSPEAILRRLKVPEEDIPLLREAVFRSPERISLQRDGITLEKAVDTIAAALPLGLRSWAGLALADGNNDLDMDLPHVARWAPLCAEWLEEIGI